MIATLVSSILLFVAYGGWNANDRTRTPNPPAPAGDIVPFTLDDGPG